MEWLGYKNLTHCYVSPLFCKSSIVPRLGRRIMLSMSKHNRVKTSELNHCYLIDKLLNPQRSCILDIDLYLSSKVEEGNLGQCLNCPCRQHQKLKILPSGVLWNFLSALECMTHIHGCRGYFFFSVQVYIRIEEDKFFIFTLRAFPLKVYN